MGGYHRGELEVQHRAGLSERAAHTVRAVRGGIPAVAAEFLAAQPLLVMGAADVSGDLWCSLLTETPGFLRAHDERTLDVAVPPRGNDQGGGGGPGSGFGDEQDRETSQCGQQLSAHHAAGLGQGRGRGASGQEGAGSSGWVGGSGGALGPPEPDRSPAALFGDEATGHHPIRPLAQPPDVPGIHGPARMP